MTQKTVIIAEAGVNHNGDFGQARRLVDVAAIAGADFVKFQTYNVDLLVTRSAEKAKYQTNHSYDRESQYQLLSKLRLSNDMFRELSDYCRFKDIGFLSTAFDAESMEFLDGLGVSRIKIPSGEITNLPYLRHVARLDKEIILSSGMATIDEIGDALDILEVSGSPRARVTVLHCTSEYPAPMSEINLRAMLNIGEKLKVRVGYSDHTRGIEVPIAAVALGATIIEKHFTLDRNLPGPDHSASLEPRELSAMVSAIRNIEIALGDDEKCLSQGEISNKRVVRKSIVASRSIMEGEVFSETNITVKRPGTGVSPMRWDDFIGKKADRNYELDELIDG